jgi:hypothetical protein
MAFAMAPNGEIQKRCNLDFILGETRNGEKQRPTDATIQNNNVKTQLGKN